MQNDVMRLFLAVPLSEETRNALSSWVSSLRKSLVFHKWVHPSDLHITIQFLGDVSSSRAEQLKTYLLETDWNTSSFSLSIKDIGSFGPSKAPQILWAGLEGELDFLRSLQLQAVERTSLLGFPKEERPYKPHVTLARKYRGSSPFDPRLTDNKDIRPTSVSLSWTVKHLILYQSHLGRNPMYEPICTIPLKESK
jgi:RNA 2',3'-cyclic 3'-phosphodiesterase